ASSRVRDSISTRMIWYEAMKQRKRSDEADASCGALCSSDAAITDWLQEKDIRRLVKKEKNRRKKAIRAAIRAEKIKKGIDVEEEEEEDPSDEEGEEEEEEEEEMEEDDDEDEDEEEEGEEKDFFQQQKYKAAKSNIQKRLKIAKKIGKYKRQ
ncbi:hypothetical protein ADUPG1_003630, partial [Aduncisulcus paluster]